MHETEIPSCSLDRRITLQGIVGRKMERMLAQSANTLTMKALPSTSQSCSCQLKCRRPLRRVACMAAAIELPSKFNKVTPKGDLVLCKVAEAEDKTTGGILLPTQAQRRPTSGDIVAVGDGKVGAQTQEFHLKIGETVLYSKFGIGVTDLIVQGEEHCLIKEDDCIGVLPRSGASADDIPDLKPNGDRVLLKVFEASDVTMGGVLLPDSAKEKPIAGEVVRIGPGKREKDGTRKAPQVKEGDKVLYFKWAGDTMETPDGQKYVVVHESDVLCKV